MTIWRHIAYLHPNFSRPHRVFSNDGDTFDLGNRIFLAFREPSMRTPGIAESVDAHGRSLLAETSFALITDFEATRETRDEQMSLAFDRAYSAASAIWISRPCSAGIHNAVNLERVGSEDTWVLRTNVIGVRHFVAHPDEWQQPPLTAEELQLAGRLNITLNSLPENSPMWTAKWFVELALHEKYWDIRYLCLWIALEALFGLDGSEVSYRLCSRLALFLEGHHGTAKQMFDRARLAYRGRSNVAHGAKKLDAKVKREQAALLEDAEMWVRRALRQIVEDPRLMEVFNSDNDATRTAYLDDLVFGSSAASGPTGTLPGTANARDVDSDPQVPENPVTGG